jgi:hypothetical protein
MHRYVLQGDCAAPRQADQPEFLESKLFAKGFNVLRKVLNPQLRRVRDNFGTPGSALIEHKQTVPACR